MEKLEKKKLSTEDLEVKAEDMYAEMINLPEVAEALEILDKLPRNLKYHTKDHTFDVIRETILFALTDGAEQSVIRQQAIAAAWHDTGYVEKPENNEPVAVELFRKSKAYHAFSEKEQQEIISNILDTQMVMRENGPHLLKGKSKFGYVLDADVSNFGRDDFFEKRAKLMEELGIDLTDPEKRKGFIKFAIELLKNHEWKTASARVLRETQKKKNLIEMEKEYNSMDV